MRVAKELDFWRLQEESWDCDDVLDAIADADKEDALMDLLEEVFYDNVPTMTEVNDLLRFDGDWVLETLGIDSEDEEDDYDEELDD
jgi:hypothetical protein